MAYEASVERSMLGKGTPPVDKPPAVREGDVIHGKYRVEHIIGEGGMGVVVAARHLSLEKQVALKLLSPKSGDSGEALERFTREARAAARIQSEHVGRVLDVDTLPSGAPFIVMELLHGHDLAVELRKGPPPLERAVTIILQACEAIAEAHAAGIVHRDLKPANLFLTEGDEGHVMVKVLDFGISKITRHEPSADISEEKALTNANTMLGSPLYMSPEQMKASGDVDARTDIWSLGVILHEMLTGASPFDGATIPIICANVLSQPPPPLGMANAPEGIERVILRCLEKEPLARYRDVAHLARSLAPFAPAQAKVTLERIAKLRGPDGMPAASPASMAPPPMREGALTITAWHTKPAQPPRRWLPLALAGGVCVLILGVVLIQASSGDDAGSSARPTGEAPADRARTAQAAETTTPAVPTPVATAAPAPTATAEATASAAPPAVSAKQPSSGGRGKWPPPKPKSTGFGGRE